MVKRYKYLRLLINTVFQNGYSKKYAPNSRTWDHFIHIVNTTSKICFTLTGDRVSHYFFISLKVNIFCLLLFEFFTVNYSFPLLIFPVEGLCSFSADTRKQQVAWFAPCASHQCSIGKAEVANFNLTESQIPHLEN